MNRENQPNQEYLLKQQEWESAAKSVESFEDRDKAKADAEIKDFVVALVAHGIPTYNSCEGGAGHGTWYPWVKVTYAEPDGLPTDPKKLEEYKAPNLEQQAKSQELLDEFYQSKGSVNEQARLVIKPLGIYGGFEIYSAGVDELENASPEEKDSHRQIYLNEMNEFAEFLKAKFFS